MTESRLGFIGIVMEDRSQAPMVNEIIGRHAHMIRARMGVPDQETSAAVIGLIVEGPNDALGALTGRLGNLPGVQVKSALTARKRKDDTL